MKTKNYELINKGEISVIIKENKGMDYYNMKPIYQYLEVSCHFNHSTLKIDKLGNEEEWTYRVMRNEIDSLANWQSRDNAIRFYVSEAAIIDAEKQVRKNIREIKRQLKDGKLNPVWLTLKPIADGLIQHYRSDFEYHDCLCLQQHKPNKFLWFVRNGGTWLIPTRNEFHNHIVEDAIKQSKLGKPESEYYYWNGKNLQTVGSDQLERLYNSLPIAQ
jgi:hypothetical protein